MEEEVEVLHPQVPRPPAPQARARPARRALLENPAAVAAPAAPVAREIQAQRGKYPFDPRITPSIIKTPPPTVPPPPSPPPTAADATSLAAQALPIARARAPPPASSPSLSSARVLRSSPDCGSTVPMNTTTTTPTASTMRQTPRNPQIKTKLSPSLVCVSNIARADAITMTIARIWASCWGMEVHRRRTAV